MYESNFASVSLPNILEEKLGQQERVVHASLTCKNDFVLFSKMELEYSRIKTKWSQKFGRKKMDRDEHNNNTRVTWPCTFTTL